MATSYISNYLEDQLVNHVFRAASFVSPTNVYVGLFPGDPGETGTAVSELSANGYQRTVAHFAAPIGGVSSNDQDVIFPVASGNWATITHIGIFDGSAVGNMLFYGKLATPVTISSGNNFRLPVGNLSVGFD